MTPPRTPRTIPRDSTTSRASLSRTAHARAVSGIGHRRSSPPARTTAPAARRGRRSRLEARGSQGAIQRSRPACGIRSAATRDGPRPDRGRRGRGDELDRLRARDAAPSLHRLLSRSPLARLNFGGESVRAPVREIDIQPGDRRLRLRSPPNQPSQDAAPAWTDCRRMGMPPAARTEPAAAWPARLSRGGEGVQDDIDGAHDVQVGTIRAPTCTDARTSPTSGTRKRRRAVW